MADSFFASGSTVPEVPDGADAIPMIFESRRACSPSKFLRGALPLRAS